MQPGRAGTNTVLRLLNFFDVEPRLMAAERCCGHDLLWSGDREGFLRLARLNVEEIRDSGVEQIVTACPECFQTLGVDYGAFGLETGVTVTIETVQRASSPATRQTPDRP